MLDFLFKDKKKIEPKLVDIGLLKVTIIMNDNTQHTLNYNGVKIDDFYLSADINRFLQQYIVNGFIKVGKTLYVNVANVKEISYERTPNLQ